MPPSRLQIVLPRSLRLALFATGLLWLVAATNAANRSAHGFAVVLHQEACEALLRAVFRLLLLLGGFTALQWIALRSGDVRSVNALPERGTTRLEWAQGGALGWALLVLAVLPAAALGYMHPGFSWTMHDLRALGFSLVALCVEALAVEVAFRGFLFRTLIGAVGEAGATLLLSLIFAFSSLAQPNAGVLSLLVTFCAGLLYSVAYLRTHGLWLGWGLRFGWSATLCLLFGLPLSGSGSYAGVVFTNSTGPAWLTGGSYGPDGSLWTAMVLIGAGVVALYRLTRGYAWEYTHREIVPAAYAVVVAPPAAHVAMETAAASAAPVLVQIAPSTPAAASTLPEAEEHLRRRGSE